MKKFALATAALALALTACTSDSSEDDSPSRSKDLAQLDFPSIEDFDAHISDRYDGTASLYGGELTVTIATSEFEHSDQMNTARVLEEAGHGAEFDYDTITVTADTPSGNWGYRYTPDTVQDVVDEKILPTDVWDAAEAGTNFAY